MNYIRVVQNIGRKRNGQEPPGTHLVAGLEGNRVIVGYVGTSDV